MMENDDNLSADAGIHIATQQEKLDAIFGITGGKSMDEFLDDLSLEDDTTENALSSIDQGLKDKIEELDKCQNEIKLGNGDLSVQIASMDHSLKEIEDMVYLAKDVMRHVAQSILATPLIDSEAVQAYSKLMESIHISIQEFIGVYRDKQNFINKVKFAMFDLQNKKELAKYKHDLALDMLKAKEGPKSIDADDVKTSNVWQQEDIIRIISNTQ